MQGVGITVKSVNERVDKRQLASSSHQSLNFVKEKFSNFHLQDEFDVFSHDEDSPLPAWLDGRTFDINELMAINDLLFALTISGVCVVMSQATKKRIGFLNTAPGEIIVSMFYNRRRDSLVTLSKSQSTEHCPIICRSINIDDLKRGDLNAIVQLFESECFTNAEFDDLGGKGIMDCSDEMALKIFDLQTYNLLFSIAANKIEKYSMSAGVLLVVYQCAGWGNTYILEILSAEDGSILKVFKPLVHRSALVFAILLEGEVLVRHMRHNLQIINIHNAQVIEVDETRALTCGRVIPVYSQHFLTITNGTVKLLNLRGEVVTTYPDENASTRKIFVTRDGHHMISYCKVDGYDGCININDTGKGNSLGRITVGSSRRIGVETTVAQALEDITALFFHEDRNEIYTSRGFGQVHVWTNEGLP